MKNLTTTTQNSIIDQTVSQSNNILTNFDFRAIDEKDPSLSQGHKLYYINEVPFEIRLEEENSENKKLNDVASFESIKCKILMGGNINNPTIIRIELSCDNDLFFHYTSDIDEETFGIMQESQKITADFLEFGNLVKKLFNDCIGFPQIYLAVFVIQKDKSARLDFIQKMEYKFVELLSIDFVCSPADTIRKQVCFRYNAIRTKIGLIQNRINTINNIVKVKNPSLLLQIQKAPAMLGGNIDMMKNMENINIK